MNVQAGFTRKSITRLVEEALDLRGIAWTVGCESESEGLRYTFNGQRYTPTQAFHALFDGDQS